MLPDAWPRASSDVEKADAPRLHIARIAEFSHSGMLPPYRMSVQVAFSQMPDHPVPVRLVSASLLPSMIGQA